MSRPHDLIEVQQIPGGDAIVEVPTLVCRDGFEWLIDKASLNLTHVSTSISTFISIHHPYTSITPPPYTFITHTHTHTHIHPSHTPHIHPIHKAASTETHWKLAVGSKLLFGGRVMRPYNDETEGFVMKRFEGHDTLVRACTSSRNKHKIWVAVVLDFKI